MDEDTLLEGVLDERMDEWMLLERGVLDERMDEWLLLVDGTLMEDDAD